MAMGAPHKGHPDSIHFIVGADVNKRYAFISEQKYNSVTPGDVYSPEFFEFAGEFVCLVARGKWVFCETVNQRPRSFAQVWVGLEKGNEPSLKARRCFYTQHQIRNFLKRARAERWRAIFPVLASTALK